MTGKALNIFATVGTQLPFDRMLKGLNQWAAEHQGTQIVAQIGETDGVFPNLECHESLSQVRFRALFSQADVIVAHAGMGTILTAAELGKPVVIMARLAKYAEHRTDHQLATAEEMSRLANVFVARDETSLAAQIDEAVQSIDADVETLGAFASNELVAGLRACIIDAVAPRANVEMPE